MWTVLVKYAYKYDSKKFGALESINCETEEMADVICRTLSNDDHLTTWKFKTGKDESRLTKTINDIN